MRLHSRAVKKTIFMMKFVRHPLSLIVFVGVFLTTAVVGLVVAHSTLQATEVSRRTNVVKLLEAVRGWSQSLDQSLASQLQYLAAREQKAAAPDNAFLTSQFQALAVFSQSDDGWSLDWWRARSAKIQDTLIQRTVDTSRWSQLSAGNIEWQRIPLQDGQVVFAVAILERANQMAVGFIDPGVFELAPFADVTGDSELFIVDDKGTAVGYPEAQYVGSKIDSHPIVAGILKSSATEDVINYRVGYKKYVGGFEQINNSNLYVVATRALPDVLSVLAPTVGRIGLISLMIASFLSVFAAGFMGRERSQREFLEQNLKLTSMKSSTTEPKTVEPESALERDEFLRAVVDYLRVPTTATVGFLQILESQLNHSTASVKKLVQELKDEAKATFQFVDSLGREIRLAPLKLEAIELPGLLNSAIASHKNKWALQNILFEDDILPDLKVKADFHRLKSAVAALLDFAVQYVAETQPPRAVETSSAARIALYAQKPGGMVEIRIEAHGRDLPAEVRRKLFVPFQAAGAQRCGLNLALANAWLTEMHGHISVEPIGPHGFQITCKVPAISTEMAANPDAGARGEM